MTADPAPPPRRWPIGVIERRWRASRPVRQLLAYLPVADRRRAVVVAVLVVVSAVLPVVFSVTTGLLVGAVPAAVRGGPESSAADRLLVLVAAAGVAFVLRQVVAPMRSQRIWELAWRVDTGLQQRVMAATAAPVGIAHLEDPEALDRINVATGMDGFIGPGQALDGVANIATRYITATCSTVVVMTWSWWLGLGTAVLYLTTTGRCRDEFRRIAEVVYGMSGTLRRADYVRNLALTPPAAKEARVFGLTRWLDGRYRETWLGAMGDVWRSRRKSLVVFLSVFGVISLAHGLSLLYVGLAGVHGRASLGTVVVVLNALSGIGGFGAISDDDLKVAQGAAPVPAALALEHEAATDLAVNATGTSPADGLPRGVIRFEDVAFAYPGGADVFDGLDLEIEAGRSLGVVGVNGAGKTTLVKLLARMYDPTRGRITVDGTDLRDLDARSWQERVAAIFQDFVRYELPARDNVGFGALPLRDDDEALARAAARAGAAAVVAGLPGGWETVLSRQYTGGADLSGGEWQRVALARALLAVEGGAGVLVLDEPTANLDVRSEVELYDRFLDLTAGLTTIVISHRFSTVRRADRIVVVEGGRLVEDGTHDELLALGGRYATMFRLQAARFRDDERAAALEAGAP